MVAVRRDFRCGLEDRDDGALGLFAFGVDINDLVQGWVWDTDIFHRLLFRGDFGVRRSSSNRSGEILFVLFDFKFEVVSDECSFVAWSFLPHLFDNPFWLFGYSGDSAKESCSFSVHNQYQLFCVAGVEMVWNFPIVSITSPSPSSWAMPIVVS